MPVLRLKMMGIAGHSRGRGSTVPLQNRATSSTCGVWRNWSTGVTPSICSRRRSESARRAQRSRHCRTPRPPRESCWRRAADLRLRALPRRIEHDRIVVAQLLRHQRAPEQVAGLGLDRLQSARSRSRLSAAPHRAGIAVECRDPRFRGEPQRERSDPAKQIGDMLWRVCNARSPAPPALPRRRRWPAGTSPAAG